MFTPALTIQKKRDGKELTREQIGQFIGGLASGDVTDYQATAFMMATYFRGMTLNETVALTEAMLKSGERYDLSSISGTKVDKHSTGGVGDKVSLILAPLAAACGAKVPMMAGRGLGHTGGTLDKLESISGFDVHLPRERFVETLGRAGCVIVGQSEKMVPADRKLYALRDVTATIECIPLIVASILSKKLAEGTDALVMDIKVGNGAFMKSRQSARTLARTLIQVARKLGLRCRAVVTDMSQPLGYAVGNSLEVIESINVLRGERSGPYPLMDDCASCDLKELTLQLCAQMLELSGVCRKLPEARKLALSKLSDGSAWSVFQQMVAAQGGDVSQIEDTRKLPIAPKILRWTAKKRGYITAMDTQQLGQILVEMGGGRKKASDYVDSGVGLIFHRKLGARVQAGDPIATVFAREETPDLTTLEEAFHQAVQIGSARKPVPKLLLEVIG